MSNPFKEVDSLLKRDIDKLERKGNGKSKEWMDSMLRQIRMDVNRAQRYDSGNVDNGIDAYIEYCRSRGVDPLEKYDGGKLIDLKDFEKRVIKLQNENRYHNGDPEYDKLLDDISNADLNCSKNLSKERIENLKAASRILYAGGTDFIDPNNNYEYKAGRDSDGTVKNSKEMEENIRKLNKKYKKVDEIAKDAYFNHEDPQKAVAKYKEEHPDDWMDISSTKDDDTNKQKKPDTPNTSNTTTNKKSNNLKKSAAFVIGGSLVVALTSFIKNTIKGKNANVTSIIKAIDLNIKALESVKMKAKKQMGNSTANESVLIDDFFNGVSEEMEYFVFGN